MSSEKVTTFAQTNYRNTHVKFGIKTDDRRRHMYFIGKTGMGKSTVLENMIIQDIQEGKGVCVVDPHGDLVEKIINFIPASRVNDVIYFNTKCLCVKIVTMILNTKVDMKNNKVVGLEALLRWNHPQKGLVYPDDFLPLIEHDFSLMVNLETGYLKMLFHSLKLGIYKD